MKQNSTILIVLITILSSSCGKNRELTPELIPFTDSRDGHVYQSVRIGTQTWMAENLAYLPAVSPSSESSATEAHYYVYGYEGNGVDGAQLEGNYSRYGVLYNYTAAQTACPVGWHLPTGKEWDALNVYLGLQPGKKLKSTSEWREDGDGDNSSGFNAWPSGEQYTQTWGYTDLGWFAFYWTSTDGEYRFLSWNNHRIDSWDRFIARSETPKMYGLSVRCLQD